MLMGMKTAGAIVDRGDPARGSRAVRGRPDLPRPATRPGSDTRKVLKEAGIDGDRIQALADGGVIPSET